MGWFLALFATLGLLFGGRMLQQQVADRQPGLFESRTRALIETYSDVIDEPETFTDLLTDAIEFDEILRDAEANNAINDTRIVSAMQDVTNYLNDVERDLQQIQRLRRELIIQQIRVAS